MAPVSGSIDSTIARGINVVSRCTQFIAATLETLLHRDADALDRRSGIMAQINQSLQRLAVGQEVIKQQHMVAFVEIPLGHDRGEFLLLGEGVDGGGVLVAIEIDGLRLLGEHHRCIVEDDARQHRRYQCRKLQWSGSY